MTASRPTMIALDKLRRDGGTQPRDHISPTVAQDYAEALADGDEFPPVTAFFDGTDYWVADGFHRILAHELIEAAAVPVDVRQGDRRDAVLFSVGANAAHGYRRTSADKRRAVLTLLNDPEWAGWSDREIARRCAVSHPTVSALRPKASLVNSSSDEARTFTDRHGNESTMQTGSIGKPSRALPIVAGRQAERKPDLAFATSDESMVTTASRITGLSTRHITEMARNGEIEGAHKDSGAWILPTAELVKLVEAEPAEVPAKPASYDHTTASLLLDIADTFERIAKWPPVETVLDMWGRDIGAGPDEASLTVAAEWLAEFESAWPVVAASRETRINEALEGSLKSCPT